MTLTMRLPPLPCEPILGRPFPKWQISPEKTLKQAPHTQCV